MTVVRKELLPFVIIDCLVIYCFAQLVSLFANLNSGTPTYGLNGDNIRPEQWITYIRILIFLGTMITVNRNWNLIKHLFRWIGHGLQRLMVRSKGTIIFNYLVVYYITWLIFIHVWNNHPHRINLLMGLSGLMITVTIWQLTYHLKPPIYTEIEYEAKDIVVGINPNKLEEQLNDLWKVVDNPRHWIPYIQNNHPELWKLIIDEINKRVVISRHKLEDYYAPLTNRNN